MKLVIIKSLAYLNTLNHRTAEKEWNFSLYLTVFDRNFLELIIFNVLPNVIKVLQYYTLSLLYCNFFNETSIVFNT